MKIVKRFRLKIVIFTAVKNCSVLHRLVFVMIILLFSQITCVFVISVSKQTLIFRDNAYMLSF